MVDITALRSARPDVLESAAREWKAIGAGYDEQVSDMKTGVIAPLREDWSGQAADAALAALNRRAADLDVLREYAETMATLMSDAAGGITDAQAWLKQADDLAARSGLTVRADGSVGTAASLLSVNGVESRVEELIEGLPPAAKEITALAQRALAIARETDDRVTTRLKGTDPGTAESGNLAAASGALAAAAALGATLARDAIPARGTDPKKVSAWWKSLPAWEQQRLINQDPTQIGWLDGLPAAARSQANNLAMHRQEAQLTGELQSLNRQEPPQYSGVIGPHQMPTTQWQQWNAKVTRIKYQLAQITTLDTNLARARTATGSHNVYLLGFDTNGNGHAIVAVGNPDTATNTATYVPGLGTHLSGSGGDIDRTITMYQQATATASAGQKISSVYWLGYNPPQHHGIQHTAGTGDAIAGAPDLANFQNGLSAAHQPGVPDHTTVIGHSYGSLVVGEAAVHSHMKPTDIVFVGSPGVGVTQASQLGVSPSHVWAGANEHDPVTYTAQFGDSPSGGYFGGQSFDANYDPQRTFSGPDFAAHSAYWDDGSSSLNNMANIVVGKYSAVTKAK